MLTKEQLIGKKFKTVHDTTVYTIKDGERGYMCVTWDEDAMNDVYTVNIINDYLHLGTWKLVEDDITTTNKMEEVIELGDTITSLRFPDGISGVVNRIENDKYYIGNRDNEHYTFEQAKLISKGMGQAVIEVGDIVKIVQSYKCGTNAKVLGIEGNKYNLEHDNIIESTGNFETTNGFNLADIKLVSKGSKQEVVGYELLKDLPGIPTGTKSNYRTGNGVSFTGTNAQCTYTHSQLSDTTWFKPIYKAKEVIVKISKERDVIVSADRVQLSNDKEFVTKQQLLAIKECVELKRTFKTGIIPYPLEILVIKIGCQEFTREDIALVYKAVQNFK